MVEVNVKYKWQQYLIDEIEELNFNDAFERALFVASLGDRMDHRDLWELDYLTKYLKEMYENVKPEPAWWEPIYKCPKCNRLGFPSIFGNYCTACGNKERGV